MGKIVKYCASCEESFAEKFAFCPNCGSQMQAFEMNPLKNAEAEKISSAPVIEPLPVVADTKDIARESVPASYEAASKDAPAVFAEMNGFSENIKTEEHSNGFDFDSGNLELELFDNKKIEQKIEKPETAYLLDQKSPVSATEKDSTEEIETVVGSKISTSPEYPEKEVATLVGAKATAASAAATSAAAASTAANMVQPQAEKFHYQPESPKRKPLYNDGFNVTVIQEKNVKQRNVLLLGATMFMLMLIVGGMIYSIFNHPLLVGAIGDESFLAYVGPVEEVPMEIEEQPKPKADKDSGGGGGGGREEETETSKGRLATQVDKPLIAPDKSIVRKDNFLEQPIAATQGNKIAKQTDEPYGDPNSKYTLGSNGRGKGGGQGSGEGNGQGSGRGTGQGSGLGSGSGGGNGGGNGNGDGDGNSVNSPPPPPPKKAEPVGVTQKIKFISKPKANYTDQARTNQIQGTVRLRVTFTASGQIGSIAPVAGLPYGLTEQAIAAARQIRFEPAMRNGVPIPTTAVVEYNFNIY